MGNGYGIGMMGGQYSHGRMMGGHQQNPAQQGTPVAGVPHMNKQHFAYQMAHIQVRAGTPLHGRNCDRRFIKPRVTEPLASGELHIELAEALHRPFAFSLQDLF